MIRVLRKHGHLTGVELLGRRFESRTLQVNADLLTGCPGGGECQIRLRGEEVGRRFLRADDLDRQRAIRQLRGES